MGDDFRAAPETRSADEGICSQRPIVPLSEVTKPCRVFVLWLESFRCCALFSCARSPGRPMRPVASAARWRRCSAGAATMIQRHQKDILAKGISARCNIEITIAYDPDKTTGHENPVYDSKWTGTRVSMSSSTTSARPTSKIRRSSTACSSRTSMACQQSTCIVRCTATAPTHTRIQPRGWSSPG